jgi:hypothetical protein
MPGWFREWYSGEALMVREAKYLIGFFYRTIRIIENGIKPAYVFDGKPPELKAGVVRPPPSLIPLISLRLPCSSQNVSTSAAKQKKKAKRQKKQAQPKISIFSLGGPSKLPRSTMRNADSCLG